MMVYSWFDDSDDVAALQALLGVADDGVYGRVTLDAHRAALVAAGLSTDHLPNVSAPHAPGDVAASEYGDESSTVSWTEADHNHGSSVYDYIVEYSTDGLTWTTFDDGVGTDTEVTVTGLTNGTSYTFRVSAVNWYAASNPSLSGAVLAATVPDAVTGLGAVWYEGAQSTLSWAAPADSGGLAITDYIVEYSTDGSTWTTFADGTSPTTGATVTGLDNATSYTFRITATNQLGNSSTATDTATTATVIELASGEEFVCALLGDGTVKCWGENDDGELGTGDTDDRGDNRDEMGANLAFVDLGTGRTAVALAAGEEHVCALLDNATVKCWGDNGYGQLGQGDTDDRGDDPDEMGDNLAAVDLGTGRTAVAITAGEFNVCAILDNATVKCWGDNVEGQLGQGDQEDRGDDPDEMGDNLAAIDLGAGRTAVAIGSGYRHSCALLDDATVKCWGRSSYGQLGQGDEEDRGDDPDEMGENLAAIDLGTDRTAVAIATTDDFVCALLDDTTLKCWGDNNYGQLGQGDEEDRGDDPDEMGDNLPAIDLGTGRTAVAIGTGADHICALLDDATVKCWGDNGQGQLGQDGTDRNDRGDDPGEMGDNLAAVDLGIGRTASAISVGGEYTCVILGDTKALCWGRNRYGQLGQGDNARRGGTASPIFASAAQAASLGTGRTATAISTGAYHSCALLDDATVKCWGNNWAGQLGLGDTDYRGDDPDEMGDNLTAIDLGTGRTATAIHTSDSHSCALLDDATVKCWGYNWSGQLGQGDQQTRGDGAGEMGDNLTAVDLGTGRTATTISTSAYHSCALLDDATVKCWGSNEYGQLGLGDTDGRGDGAGEMGDNLTAVDLGAGRTAVAIAAGQEHTCALLDDATVKCWGVNGSGQLGSAPVASPVADIPAIALL